jgi:hypothetical protein
MSQQIIIDYWVEKAGEDLVSARDNLKSGRLLRGLICTKKARTFLAAQ